MTLCMMRVMIIHLVPLKYFSLIPKELLQETPHINFSLQKMSLLTLITIFTLYHGCSSQIIPANDVCRSSNAFCYGAEVVDVQLDQVKVWYASDVVSPDDPLVQKGSCIKQQVIPGEYQPSCDVTVMGKLLGDKLEYAVHVNDVMIVGLDFWLQATDTSNPMMLTMRHKDGKWFETFNINSEIVVWPEMNKTSGTVYPYQYVALGPHLIPHRNQANQVVKVDVTAVPLSIGVWVHYLKEVVTNGISERVIKVQESKSKFFKIFGLPKDDKNGPVGPNTINPQPVVTTTKRPISDAIIDGFEDAKDKIEDRLPAGASKKVGKSKLPIWAVVLICVVGVIILLICLCICCCCCKKKRQNQQQQPPPAQQQ